jgi:galactokinase
VLLFVTGLNLRVKMCTSAYNLRVKMCLSAVGQLGMREKSREVEVRTLFWKALTRIANELQVSHAAPAAAFEDHPRRIRIWT